MSRRLSTLAWLCSSPGSPRQRKRAGNSAQQGGQNGSVGAFGKDVWAGQGKSTGVHGLLQSHPCSRPSRAFPCWVERVNFMES